MARQTRSFLNLTTGSVEHVPDIEDEKNNQDSLYTSYREQPNVYVEVNSAFEPTEEAVDAHRASRDARVLAEAEAEAEAILKNSQSQVVEAEAETPKETPSTSNKKK